MAAKIKCPACGAKNGVDTHRCRICTAVINPDAARPAATEEPVTPLGIDHFDAGEIDRQVRPARERFTSASGGLSARIAAAGGSASETPSGVGPPSDDAESPAPGFERPLPPRAASPAPMAEHTSERFDPDALFRDMD